MTSVVQVPTQDGAANFEFVVIEADGTITHFNKADFPRQILEFIARHTGGGLAGQQIYFNAGDPNGVVTALTIAPCLCLDSTDGSIWWKTDGLLTNTGWG